MERVLGEMAQHPLNQPMHKLLVQGMVKVEQLIRELDDYFGPSDTDEQRRAKHLLIEYVREVETLLSKTLIDATNNPKVFLNMSVTAADESTGETESYTVVCPDEIDADVGKISCLSPIGAALLLQPVGQIVMLQAPGGTFHLRIIRIEPPSH